MAKPMFSAFLIEESAVSAALQIGSSNLGGPAQFRFPAIPGAGHTDIAPIAIDLIDLIAEGVFRNTGNGEHNYQIISLDQKLAC